MRSYLMKSITFLMGIVLAVGITGALIALTSGVAHATTFTVSNTSDSVLDTGSLRYAITEANKNSDVDTINFSSALVIQPGSQLPEIIYPVIIDATSQSGVCIDGVNAGLAHGLWFGADADASEVKGLSIYNFQTGNGVYIQGASDVKVYGDYIGTNASGAAGLGNNRGVIIQGPCTGCIIGGDTAAERNVISGNITDGVDIDGCTANTVEGNFIGTNLSGTAALPNGGDGVKVMNASANNVIGGSGTPAAFNLISGNTGDGVEIEGSNNNYVTGNFIGTDLTGTKKVPNQGNGVLIEAGSNYNYLGLTGILGAARRERAFGLPAGAAIQGAMNLISGNHLNGVRIEYSYGNTLTRNLIGTDEAAAKALGNGESGVCLIGSQSNYIGTLGAPTLPQKVRLKLRRLETTVQLQNAISGNGRHGVYMEASSFNYVMGNVIGGGAGTNNHLPNKLDGVYMYGSGRSYYNFIGGGMNPANTAVNNGQDGVGLPPVMGPNAIVFNGRDGVGMHTSTDCVVIYNLIFQNRRTGVVVWDKYSWGDTISQNTIYDNGALGISLGGSGVPTPNDGNNDNPNKPNRGFNYPVFSSSIYKLENGKINVSGTAPPGSLVELFKTGPEPDPSGHGEGASYLTTVNATAGGEFSATLSGLVDGDHITSTATWPGIRRDTPKKIDQVVGAGSTSEFSANAAVVSPDLTIIKAADVDEEKPGGPITYTITIKNNSAVDATGVTFYDKIPDGTVLVPGSVTCSDHGATIVSENPVKITGITVRAGKTVTIGFKVNIKGNKTPGTVIRNLGYGKYLGEQFKSSNPRHPGAGRSTDVLVKKPEAPPTAKVAGSKAWFIAEGSTGGGFDTWIELQNPGDNDAQTAVTFSTDKGPRKPIPVQIKAGTRTAIRVQDYVPDTWGVSTIIKSDQPIVAERSMYWDKNLVGESDTPGTPEPYEMRGGSSNLGVPTEALKGVVAGSKAAGNSNYFPEGSTAGGFDTWVLLVNPNEKDARARVTLMTGEGVAAERDVAVKALSRQTVHIDELLPDAFEVATQVTSDIPLVAERSMYWDGDAANLQPYEMTGGHSNAGSPSAAKRWFLSEGATAAGFDTYVLLQNPNDGKANLTAEFMTEDGVAKTAHVTMAPMSRGTVKVSDYVPDSFNVSTRVTSDKPVVAERSTYWDKRVARQPYAMREGTSTVGTTRTSGTWIVPEGSTGIGFETFVTITNTEDRENEARVAFSTEEGTGNRVKVVIPANSRYTVRLSDHVPNKFNVSTIVKSEGQLVVERSMYWDTREPSPMGDPEIRPYEMMGGHSSGAIDP